MLTPSNRRRLTPRVTRACNSPRFDTKPRSAIASPHTFRLFIRHQGTNGHGSVQCVFRRPRNVFISVCAVKPQNFAPHTFPSSYHERTPTQTAGNLPERLAFDVPLPAFHVETLLGDARSGGTVRPRRDPRLFAATPVGSTTVSGTRLRPSLRISRSPRTPLVHRRRRGRRDHRAPPLRLLNGNTTGSRSPDGSPCDIAFPR